MPLVLPEARFTGTNLRDEEARGAPPVGLVIDGSRAWAGTTGAVPCRDRSLVAVEKKNQYSSNNFRLLYYAGARSEHSTLRGHVRP